MSHAGYNMYTFCNEFHILVSNVCWNFIILLKMWREYHLDVATTVIIFHCIILLYHCEAFRNSFYLEVYFMGGRL